MSKFLEYVHLLPKAFKNRKNILKGWLTDIKMEAGDLPENEVEEIVRRRSICEECPLNSIKALKSEEYKKLYVEHYETDRLDFHCSICGCPIKKKSASLNENCGLEEYNNEHPENKQELKWKQYKK